MRVLLTEPIHEQGISFLRHRFDIVEANTRDENAICELIAQCHGVLVRTAKITEKVLSAAPELLCVAKHGVGVDNIDLVAATRRNIKVVNAPFSNCNAVAEHAFGFMFALLRQTALADAEIRKGNYAGLRAGMTLGELTGKTVGFIGFGRIPRRICRFLAPFDVKILFHDPYATASTPGESGATACQSLRELLHVSDIVSIHVPLTEETRNILQADTIAAMKKGALLVNTARGGIVDEEAVAAALESGHLGGAAFDVFEQEPPLPGSPLLRCEKAILSPHSAALTGEALINMAVQSAENLAAVLQGLEPTSCVNSKELNEKSSS